jgi:hypothetical protein
MSESVHSCRWIAQVADQNWELHLVPSLETDVIYPEMQGVTIHNPFYFASPPNPSVKLDRGQLSLLIRLLLLIFGQRARRLVLLLAWAIRRYAPKYRVNQLVRIIRKVKPDIIHLMEMSTGSSLVVEAMEQLGEEEKPPLIVGNWGPELQFFGRLANYGKPIHEALAIADYYTCDCQRDIEMAKHSEFTGELLPSLLAAGGFDVPYIAQFRQKPTSSRRLILLKGYQGLMGRALVALRSFDMCRSELQGYKIAVYSAYHEEVRIAVELLAQSGMDIEVVPRLPKNEDMLALFGRARVYIGLSISDGVSTSAIQAMITGTFPIQSCTACIDEWIVDGETGIIVPPEDPYIVAEALRRALTDDELVDTAAERNYEVCAARADLSVLKPQVIKMYEKVEAQGRITQRLRHEVS